MSAVHCSIESDSEDNPTLLDQRGEDIQHNHDLFRRQILHLQEPDNGILFGLQRERRKDRWV